MIWEYWNLSAFILKIIFNVLFSFGILGSKTTKEISDDRKTSFTPAKYTFSIWIVIYGFQGVFVISSLFISNPIVDRISVLYILLCVINILWLFAFGYERFNLSCLLITAMLTVLILIYNIIGIGFFLSEYWVSQITIWFNFVPFSIYLGWVSVAFIANHFVANYKKDLEDKEEASLFIIYLTLPTSLLIWFRGDIVFALVVLWGVIGILVNNFEGKEIKQSVIFCGSVLIIVTAIRFILMLF